VMWKEVEKLDDTLRGEWGRWSSGLRLQTKKKVSTIEEWNT
jgi:hypothetical protein